jgi:uncharacterized membrane protein YidH (DUF202 family)
VTVVLPFLIAAAAIAVLVVLAIGIINMFRRDHDPRRSNKLMQWRIILQFAAIMLLVLFLFLMKH